MPKKSTKKKEVVVKAFAVIDSDGRAWDFQIGAIVPNAMKIFVTQESARNHAREIYKKFMYETFVTPCVITYTLNPKTK